MESWLLPRLHRFKKAHVQSTGLETAGVKGIDASRGPRFPQLRMATQATAQGHGVALMHRLLGAISDLPRPLLR